MGNKYKRTRLLFENKRKEEMNDKMLEGSLPKFYNFDEENGLFGFSSTSNNLLLQ